MSPEPTFVLQEVIVMICGPHHLKRDASRDGYVCPAEHEGTRCCSRIDHAIKVALAADAPLIVCGDANEGRDVRAFCERARRAGVRTVCQAVRTDGPSNTFHDLSMAARMATLDPEFAEVRTFRLVTDPWHMPRAAMMAEDVIRSACADAGVAPFDLKTSDVDPCWDPPPDMLQRERAGLLAFSEGTYKGGHAAGKPMLEVKALRRVPS